MKKRILPFLKSPDTNLAGMKVYGTEVLRDNTILKNLEENQILDSDDIISGILVSEQSNILYPISNCIPILLSFNDIDTFHYIPLIEALKNVCPVEYHAIFKETLSMIHKSMLTPDGEWNRDEMRYYDAEVDTYENRTRMVETIKKIPVHRMLIPRQQHIISVISAVANQTMVLEIGCGNASTVYRIFNPEKNNYIYIGSDISFKRLMVAKALIPSGDFIQASALNLPFTDNIFSSVISFGMLHHLPRPIDAILQVTPLLKKNGLLAFHEPILRPSFTLPGLNTIKKAMTTYQHSEHDGKIDLDATIRTLDNSGFNIIYKSMQISALRSASEAIIKKINRKIMLNKTVVQLMEKSDQQIIRLLNLFSKKLQSKAVFIVAKKN